MDVLNILKAAEEFGKQFSDEETLIAVSNNVREMAIDMAMDELLWEARGAIDETPEFQHPLLRDRLLSNLSDPRHYRLDDSLSELVIFDEDVAGTVSDLVQGQRAAWSSAGGTKEQRLFCWTYGIYKPGREGMGVWDRFQDYPAYEDVISIRLDEWGDKAPYWIFLEWGNAGGEAYPSFPGTGFIERTRARAPELLRRAIRVTVSDFCNQMDLAVTEQLESETTVPVQYGRVPFGRVVGKKAQIETRISKTGVWYMLIVGGRYAGRINPGEVM